MSSDVNCGKYCKNMSKFFTNKKTTQTLAEINMIPLVDIVFNLLIIFMILAPMIHKGVEVQVPESSAGESLSKQNQHIVSITREGRLWFDDQETSLEHLQEHLQTIAPDDTIYVQSDKSVPYGQVVEVISQIKENGLQKVGLVTVPRPPKTGMP